MTRSKRRLGRYLRPFLDRTGMTFDQVAKETRCSRQTVSRLFSGEHLPRFHLFTTLIAVIGVTGKLRSRPLEPLPISHGPAATVDHARVLPAPYGRSRVDDAGAALER